MTQMAKGIDTGVVPAGWEWSTLEAVATIKAGSSAPQGGKYFSHDGPPFVRVSDLSVYGRTVSLNDSADHLSPVALRQLPLVKVPSGTVLFPKSGAAINTNNRAILSTDAYIVGHLMSLIPNGASTSDWIYMWLCQLDMAAFSDNPGYPSLKRSNVADIPIPLPPLPEQKRIAAILNEQMAAVEQAKKATEERLEAARALPAAYLREVFPSSEDELPDGWKWTTVRDISDEILTGPFGSTLHKSDYVEGGVPVINPSNLIYGKVIPTAETAVSESTHIMLSAYWLQLGDIVFARRGEMGRCAKVTESEVGWVCGTGSLVIRLNLEHDSGFIQSYLSSPCSKHYFEDNNVGSTMSNLNQNIVGSFPIAAPALPRQKELAKELEDRIAGAILLEESIQQELATIEAMPSALLRKAFSGDL